MKIHDLMERFNLGESTDTEFKLAAGGLPASLWETYSAMANTDGGVIFLGISDQGRVKGLKDIHRLQADLWNGLNNRQKVNTNLLSNEDATAAELDGKTILIVRVPRASRYQRPIYVGADPITGTYRRNFEGDYHCVADEVRRMLADASDIPADARILEGFSLDDLDTESLEQYRNRFSHRSPSHPWLSEDVTGLLEKLGAWRKDRKTGTKGLTVAGLLMFGKQTAIQDPDAMPQYHLDFREKLSDSPDSRWTDRLTPDGTWAGNLFQFHQRVLGLLTRDLKIPFKLQPDLFSQDQTPVHEAVREALVNALIHADYRGAGGVVIERFRDRIELSNPGPLLISFDQLLSGGLSECRNKSLQRMFQMIGGGEKAGSGVGKIRKGWQWRQWRSPGFREQVQPDRVLLVMPMVSLLPPESLASLHRRFGTRIDSLDARQTQALVTAQIEGSVTNARLQELSHDHPSDITGLLQGLAARGLLVQRGKKRGSYYRLSLGDVKKPEGSVEYLPGDSERLPGDSERLPGDSERLPGDSERLPGDSQQWDDGDWTDRTKKEGEQKILERLAAPVATSGKAPQWLVRQTIVELCRGRFLTLPELGALLKRHPTGLRQRHLKAMIAKGIIELKHPNEPNRPDQAYTTKDKTTRL